MAYQKRIPYRHGVSEQRRKDKNMSVIDVSHLTKDYGYGRGVFDVSFHVDRGEVFGFLGPNGAGKSTTIRHLMGFSQPDSGSTQIFGKESFHRYYEILNHVGYIPGEIALPAGLTGWEFLRMMQDLQGGRNEECLKKLLDQFELDPSGETKRMSLGVKRKLAVVTAFMNDPDVLILDEPTSGLDPVMQEVFIDYVKNEKKRGKTILLSSHIFSVQILNRDDDARLLTVTTDDKNINKLVAALADYSVTGFAHQKETLEDYFMSYYKEDKEFGGALEK